MFTNTNTQQKAKENSTLAKLKTRILNTLDSQGIGVIEIILILLVLVGLVVIFRSQLTSIINSIFESINNKISNF